MTAFRVLAMRVKAFKGRSLEVMAPAIGLPCVAAGSSVRVDRVDAGGAYANEDLPWSQRRVRQILDFHRIGCAEGANDDGFHAVDYIRRTHALT